MRTLAQRKRTTTALMLVAMSALVAVLWLGLRSSGAAPIRLPAAVVLETHSIGNTSQSPSGLSLPGAGRIVLPSQDVIEVSPEREVETFGLGPVRSVKAARHSISATTSTVVTTPVTMSSIPQSGSDGVPETSTQATTSTDG